MKSGLMKARTLLRLGVRNLARVGVYRFLLRLGLHPVQRISGHAQSGPFFDTLGHQRDLIARTDWVMNEMSYFGRRVAISDVPNWFCGPMGTRAANSKSLWWKIPDFDPNVGDIKTIWEASRFDWVIPLAQRAALQDVSELKRLNDWIADWSENNPPYFGSNWKCGQEASIRVMHLATAGLILTEHGSPIISDQLSQFIRQHLRRIAPTIGYAIGQSNNHGTSEAAALFIGGTWLGDDEGAKWARLGRHWLENRARRLILSDGTFSQYSVTYHRMMLDTYALAVVWQRRTKQAEFSSAMISQLSLATLWLANFTDPSSGDAPVIGANDGAHLLRMTDADYRDFRPSVELGSTLFRNESCYGSGEWQNQLYWLGIEPLKESRPQRANATYGAGGFHVLHENQNSAYLRFPRFRFRPSQADVLHLDFWSGGENILRDAGTFSYNVSDADTAYFNGTLAHNTVQFDKRDQMPRLSRFLFGDWLSSERVSNVSDTSAAAGYTDKAGAKHFRRVDLTDRNLTVVDEISGFETAVLRWRLIPGEWFLDGNVLRGEGFTLKIEGRVDDILLTTGEESRYYLEKSDIPVLEVSLVEPGTITTQMSW